MAGIICSSCGGKMVFDPDGQDLVCPYCGQHENVTAYQEDNAAEEHKETHEQMVYTCKNCGAELIAPDEQTVAYCAYCGSEAMLEGKYEEVMRPKRIIPFCKSKEDAKKEYEKNLKKILYVPNDYKNPEFLEGFRGIYLPYYNYEAVIPQKSLNLQGVRSYTSGGYDYTEVYDIQAEIGGTAKGMRYDASIAFDDTIANEIAPFNVYKEKEYNPAYVAGFYADKATTPVKTYIEHATEDAVESVYEEISKRSFACNIQNRSMEQKKAEIGIDSFECNVTMFPIWFLTWRNKNRVAYSVMNGENGRMAMDVPVDKKKFFLVSLIAAAVIFIILSILPIFILPKTLMCLSALIAAIAAIPLQRETQRIFEKENHVYDYGDVSHAVKKKKMKHAATAKTASKTNNGGKGCLIAMGIYFGGMILVSGISIIGAIFEGLNTTGGSIFFLLVALVIHLICSIKMIKSCLYMQNKLGLFAALFGVLAIAFAIVVSWANPAHDYWYYGAALACLVGLVVSSLTAVNYFNYLTTRPVPNFFAREGADNGK